jgi:DNA-binding NarL/FixJ family response regulator
LGHTEGVIRESASPRTAVVFDRYPLYLRGVASLLESAGLRVVGTSSTPEHALDLIAEREPDLVLVGLSRPPGETAALDLMRRALAARPSLKAIAYADDSDHARVEEVFAAGACAFLDRTARQADVAFAVRQSYEPSIQLALARGGEPVRPAADAPALTERELEILRPAAAGQTNVEIARMLEIAPQTVKYHLAKVYRKLKVANRTQAARRAELLNLLAPEPWPNTGDPPSAV